MGNYGNTLFVGFSDSGTSGFDYGGDAVKLYSNADQTQMYTMENESKLCININESVSYNESKIIPLYLDQVVDGDYTLEVSQLDNLPDLTVLLEDIKTGVTQNLSKQPIYSFSGDHGDNEHRFNITFTSSPSSVNDFQSKTDNINIYGGNGVVNIYSKGEAANHEGNLLLYSINGQLILEKQISTGNLISVPVISNQPIIIAMLHKQGEVFVEKIVIK